MNYVADTHEHIKCKIHMNCFRENSVFLSHIKYKKKRDSLFTPSMKTQRTFSNITADTERGNARAHKLPAR